MQGVVNLSAFPQVRFNHILAPSNFSVLKLAGAQVFHISDARLETVTGIRTIQLFLTARTETAPNGLLKNRLAFVFYCNLRAFTLVK